MKIFSLVLVLLFGMKVFANESLTFVKIYEGETVQSIIFKGNKTKKEIIERELETKIGKPLEIKTLEADLKRLENLDIFSKIVLGGVQNENGIELIFDFKEVLWALPYVSYQISDENGLALGPAVRSVNFLHRDITLNAFFLFGGFTSYAMEFNWPWIFGNHVSVYFYARHIVRENLIDNYNEVLDEFFLKSGSYLEKNYRVFGEFEFLHIKNDGILDSSSTIHKQKDGTFEKVTLGKNADNLPTFGISFVYDTRDVFNNPNSGSWNELKISKTGGFSGGKANFQTFGLDLEKYFPITKKQTIQIAVLSNLRNGKMGKNIPYNLDYHIGGVNSVRGYDISSEDQLFGKNQFIGTFEYRYNFVPQQNISLFGLNYRLGASITAFTDFGTASNSLKNYGKESWRQGFGFGLNFLLPSVDVSRIELAWNKNGDFNPTILISFYKTFAQKSRIR